MVKQVALIAAGTLIIGLLLFADLWLSSALGLAFVMLTAVGWLAVAVILGSLWRDRLPVRILRRSLIVLALLMLIIGTGFIALEWLGVFPANTGRFFSGPAGQRAISILFIWPITGFLVWWLGAMALLARRRFAAAAMYTLSAFAAIVVIAAVVVVIPAWVPFFAPVGLVNAPGWVGALCFLALDAAVIYLAWTRLFGSDFAKAPNTYLGSPRGRG